MRRWTPAPNARAFGAAAYADWLARKATPAEHALTAAMVKRYSLDPKADRATLDAAFADAMLAAARRIPAHDDIALLAAEAAMNTRPWDYWTADKQPQPRLGEAIAWWRRSCPQPRAIRRPRTSISI